MIEAQEMENGRLEIVNVDFIAAHGEAELIGLTISEPAFDAAPARKMEKQSG